MTAPARYWLQLGDDPAREVRVCWQEDTDDEDPPTSIDFRRLGESSWNERSGSNEQHPFTGSGYDRDRRVVHRVDLDELDPDTVYEFRFNGYDDVFRFETFPDSLSGGRSRQLAFAGDADNTGDSSGMSMSVAGPATEHMRDRGADAVVVKGDWAYADGLESRFARWDDFWDTITPALTRSDGTVVPIVPVIGNHEVVGGYNGDRDDAPYFFAYFYFPDTSDGGAYRVHRAGSWLALLVIDTEHATSNLSESHPQIGWLDEQLDATGGVTYRLATYHVPYYPGQRDPDASQQQRLRDVLAPRFEGHGVRAVFDAHDHVYARTRRIKDGAEDSEGVVYYGQGGYGADLRAGDSLDEWYVDEGYGANDDSDRAHHFYEVELTDDGMAVRSVSATTGDSFHVDHYPADGYPAEPVSADWRPAAVHVLTPDTAT